MDGATIKVRAKAPGYYGHRRIREGVVFDMGVEACKKGKNEYGDPILPSWVEYVEKPARKPGVVVEYKMADGTKERKAADEVI